MYKLLNHQIFDNKFLDRRFTDHSNNRVVHAPTVRISEPNGVNPKDVADALGSGGKGKKQKAYRR